MHESGVHRCGCGASRRIEVRHHDLDVDEFLGQESGDRRRADVVDSISQGPECEIEAAGQAPGVVGPDPIRAPDTAPPQTRAADARSQVPIERRDPLARSTGWSLLGCEGVR